MPLDTSAYSLALLRVDGRRWNELRRVHAQIRTQAAADGSSYLEMGHTKVMCIVNGPIEANPAAKRAAAGAGAGAGVGGGGGAGAGGGGQSKEAEVVVNIVIAGFSSVDRKRRARGDKRTQEMQATISRALSSTLHTHLYPHSAISFSLHVLSQDGSLLAALINAASLAAVDAGIPMTDYLAACSAGSTSDLGAGDDRADPLLDLNQQEETELPSLTVATLGDSDRVSVLVSESRVQIGRLEGMLAVGVDGCKQVRTILDRVVKERGRKMLREGAIDKGDDVGGGDMEIDG